MAIETNRCISHLLEGRIVGTTPTGLPMYEPDPVGEYYQRITIEPKENSLQFLRQEQSIDKIALDSMFNKLNMISVEGDIYYFPKNIVVKVQSSKSKIPYLAITNGDLFAIKAKKEKSKSGYEPLFGFGTDVSFYKTENIGAPGKISTNLGTGHIFYKSPTWKLGETYFNLSKVGVLGDFDKFCAFKRRCDLAAHQSKLPKTG